MNIETIKKTVATCLGLKSCFCFNKVFNLLPFFNIDDEFDYISNHKNFLIEYLNELTKHMNKDRVYNQNLYKAVTAETVQKSFLHHLETLRVFERYLNKTFATHFITFQYLQGGEVDLRTYLKTILSLTSAHEKTIRLFNYPDSPIIIHKLLDDIDLHLFTINIFEKFLLFQTLDKTLQEKNYGDFKFRRYSLQNPHARRFIEQNNIENCYYPRFCRL